MIDLPEVPPLLYIVSGPAGSGKTTVCARLLDEFEPVHRIVTTTTRPPRSGEVDGQDYHFLPKEDFQNKVTSGEFLEHAQVHTNLYGTQRQHVLEPLTQGHDLLLNIDVQGAQTFRNLGQTEAFLRNRVVSIFIMPQDLDQIRQRLIARGLDDIEDIDRRLKVAQSEVEAAKSYDYIIQSQSKDLDYARLKAIYLAEKLGRQKRFN